MKEQSPWIDHGPSKPCPFSSPYTSRVDIRLRDGTEVQDTLACNTSWFWYEHDKHGDDVVAYRVPAQAAHTPSQPAMATPLAITLPMPVMPDEPEDAIDDSWMDGYNAALRMREQCVRAIEAAGQVSVPVVSQQLTTAASLPGGVPGPLPHWEPCNPGCDPNFNGQRSRECAQLCHAAREALSAAPAAQPVVEQCDHQWTDDGQHLLVCTSCGAQEDHDPRWRDLATAPRDGTMVRLLVEFTENSTEDADQAPTIGANNFDNDGEDRWQFAGWCWSHDHFTEGKGEPIGWLPMLEEPRRIAAEQQEQQP